MTAFAVFFLCALTATHVLAQGNATVSGSFTPGHTVRCENSTCTVMVDAGGAGGVNTSSHNYLTELGIRNTGLPFCIDSAATNNPGGYYRMCLGANVSGGGALLAFDAMGGASPLPWQVEKDGAFYPFPPTGNGNVLGPGSSVVDDLIAFNNTGGTLVKDASIPRSAVSKGRMVIYSAAGWTSDATNTAAWSVIVPPGLNFTCVTTNSQCFAEALAFAQLQGLSVDTFCRGENQLGPNSGPPDNRLTTTVYPFIASTVPINTGPLVQRYVRAHGCNITFSTAVTSAAFTVDTALDGGRPFDWDGQIVGTYNTPSDSTFTLLFKATTCPPAEGCAATVIQNTVLRAGAVVGGTSGGATPHGAVVGFDATVGSILASQIEIGEINGCGPCTPVAVFEKGIKIFGGNVAGTRGFLRNQLTVGYIHNVVIPIDNGSTDNTDPANPKAYNDNIFIMRAASPGTTAGGCMIDSGNHNIITILSCNNDSLGAGLYSYALSLTAITHYANADIHALGYSATINTIASATTPFPILDAGLGNSYTLNGQEIQRWSGADRGIASASGMQSNYLPLASITNATAVSTPTNTFGQVSVTGTQTSVTINFSKATGQAHAFQRSPGCDPTSNQAVLFTTNTTQDSATFTVNTGSMPNGTIITYGCRGAP